MDVYTRGGKWYESEWHTSGRSHTYCNSQHITTKINNGCDTTIVKY